MQGNAPACGSADRACPRVGLMLVLACWLGALPLLAQNKVCLAPSKVVEVEVSCVNAAGRVVPHCAVSVQTAPVAGSNSHLHTGARPSGRLGTAKAGPFSNQPLVVNTGLSGMTMIWLRTTSIGQAEDLISCSHLGCNYQRYCVGYDHLRPVPENTLWSHVGGNTTNHGGNYYNHWMTPDARAKFRKTVVSFREDHPSLGKVAVNDMSLPGGGVFDIHQNWKPPHYKHSEGTAVDIRGNGA